MHILGDLIRAVIQAKVSEVFVTNQTSQDVQIRHLIYRNKRSKTILVCIINKDKEHQCVLDNKSIMSLAQMQSDTFLFILPLQQILLK